MVHVREDPHCRLHGVTQRMNVRLAQPYPPPLPTPAEEVPQRTETPLDQRTAFRTQGGLHLLFEHEAARPAKGYMDTQMGEPLGPAERAAYEVYLRRLCERHRVGEQADRLARIVDKYLPKVADENQAYVMRYPHKVNAMLKKAWAMRRRIRAKRKRKRGKENSRSDAEAATPTEPRAPEQTERLQDVQGNMGPHVTKATSASEDTPPDWGGEEEDSSPDGQDKEQAASAQWPWGPAGRPSDQDAEQQRPNEPAGEPPRKTILLAD